MKTLNLLIAASFLSAAPAFAGNAKLESAVLRTLVAQSGEITLLGDDGKPMEANMQLPSLFAGALNGGYLSASKGYVTLTDVSVSCEVGLGNHGAEQWDCSVNMNNGDFTVRKDGSLEGPETESSISFQVPVAKGPGKIRLLSKQFKAMLAG